MSEAAAIRLRHVTFVTTGKAFVSGGRTVSVTEGVAEVGLAEPLDALTLWHDGYRIDADTDEEIANPGALDALIAARLDVPEADDDDEETEQVDAFVEALEADADPED